MGKNQIKKILERERECVGFERKEGRSLNFISSPIGPPLMTPPPPIESSRRDEFAGGPRAAVATVVRRGEENKVSGCLKEVVWATKSRREGHQRVHRRRRSQTGAGRRRPTIGGGSHAPPRAASASGRAPGSRPGASNLRCTLLYRITPRGCTGAAVHCASLDQLPRAGTYAQRAMVNAMIRYRSGEPYLGVRLEDSFMSRIYEARAMCGHICMCLKLKEWIEVQYVDIRNESFPNDACGVRY
ncbi:hypothetical protein GQ457_15G024710 [Hibiscus cannabinus]